MGIKHLNYTAIPEASRKRAAQSAQARLRDMLRAAPVMTETQVMGIQAEIHKLDAWASGTLQAPQPSAPAPAHHDVVVEERLEVEDDL